MLHTIKMPILGNDKLLIGYYRTINKFIAIKG